MGNIAGSIVENTTVTMNKQIERPVGKIDRKMLGRRIREERLRLGMTQEDVASCIDVSTTYVGFIERGERSVTLDKLVMLAQCFRVTLDSLLKERPEQTAASVQEREGERLRSLLESTSPDEKELILSITEAIVGRRG